MKDADVNWSLEVWVWEDSPAAPIGCQTLDRRHQYVTQCCAYIQSSFIACTNSLLRFSLDSYKFSKKNFYKCELFVKKIMICGSNIRKLKLNKIDLIPHHGVHLAYIEDLQFELPFRQLSLFDEWDPYLQNNHCLGCYSLNMDCIVTYTGYYQLMYPTSKSTTL